MILESECVDINSAAQEGKVEQIELPVIELRDYLAAACVSGLVLREPPPLNIFSIAQEAYDLADAMLEARRYSGLRIVFKKAGNC